MNKEIEIPEGYKARIEGNKVILELKESEEERIYNLICSSIKNEIPISHLRNKELALAYLEKQKEQKKPTLSCPDIGGEWSKEDESMHTRTLGALGKCLFANLPVEVKEEIDWLKELPNRFNLQPKTEKLSNEEKEKIQSICDFLWKNRRGDTDTIYRMEQYINWLMKLIKE